MYKKTVLLLFVGLVLVSCSNSPSRVSEFNNLYDTLSASLKKEYAPDSREGVWEVTPYFEGNKIVLHGSTTESGAKSKLINVLVDEGFNIIDSISLLPASVLGNDIYGVVNQSVVNVRYKPDYSSEMATQLLMGTPVRVLEQVSYWYRIRTPENYLGWVNTMGITRMDEQTYTTWKGSKRLFVNTYYTLFYESPDRQSRVIGDGVWGDIVEYSNLSGEFYQVKMVDGSVGYLQHSDAIDFDIWLNTSNPSPENIVDIALKFKGFPYMWAGTSIKAMDCSGLTKTAYFLNGVILKRDASQQARYGEDIDFSNGFGNLLKGDFLFFGSKATETSPARITHVGLYMGDNNLIHASSVIRVNSLIEGDDNYYENASRLVAVKRMSGHEDKNDGMVSVKNHPWYVND